MEANDNLRTIECLRGRLIAERQASRAAKDDAELMGIKVFAYDLYFLYFVHGGKKKF